MKRISFWVAIIGAIALSACGPSAADIQKAIEQTQAAAPTITAVPTDTPIPATPTPAPIPLSEIDLEALLIQDGDLPSGVTAGQVRDLAGDKFSKAPLPAQVVFQLLEAKGESAGSVTVFLYEELSDAEATYKILHSGMGTDGSRDIDGIGDAAMVWTLEMEVLGNKIESGEVGFIRCGAVVDIVMGTADEDVITAYAKRLDKRLAEAICR